MYGQGNYAQFRPAPPNQPAPPVQPPAPGPPPRAIYHGPPFLTQSHHIPPRPLPHQVAPPALAVPLPQNIPPPAPINIGHAYGNILPPPYPPQPPTYSSSVPSHGTAHVPPPPSQGQALYQIPPPPPPFANIQHIPIPHSQPPSYFPVNAAPFSYSGSVAGGHDAQPPSLPPPPPPPPPPPSSPPPLPPSPPSVAFPVMDDVVVYSGSTLPILLGGSSLEGEAIDARATSGKSTDNSYLDHTFPVGEHINVSKKIPGDDESSRNLLSTSPKPIKEVALQQCSVSLNSSKEDLPFEAITVDNEQRNSSPASSDMDMEDDDGGQLESVTGHNILKKEPVGVPTEVADEGGSRYASQSLPNTKDKFTSTNIPQSSSEYADVSPVRSSPGDAECSEATEVPAVFIKDRSPFELIQGYASDDSEEEDGGDEIDVGSMRASSLADLPNIHTDNKIELKFASPSICQTTVEENLDRVEKNVEPSMDCDIVGTDAVDIDQLEKQQPEDARQDSDKPKLDEFGRLVREGVSDSDSEDMQYDDRRGTRCGSSSQWSPREGRHRWNRSPRRRDSKNNSPRHSLVKSFRHANKFSRKDKEQRPECFNFVRGRCIHGASCRFLHPDFSSTKTMHKIHRDPSRQSSTFDVHGHASDQERDNSASKKDSHEFDKLRQEGTEEIYTKHAESNINTTKYGDDKKDSPGSVIQSGLSKEVHDDVKQEDTSQGFLNRRGLHLGTQQVRKLSETSNFSGGDGEETLLESGNSKLVKNVAYQASPAALLEQTEQVLQGSPANKSHEKKVIGNQISDECLNEKDVKVSKFSAPDNSQLQSYIQEHTPFAIPTVNMSPPLASQQHTPSLTTATVSQLQLSESDMRLPGQHQIASEQYAQNIHAPNVISSNFHMPTISRANELTMRTSISIMEHPQLHQQNAFTPRNDFAHSSSVPNFGWEFSRPQSIDFNYRPLYHTESSHQPPVHLDKYKHNFPMGVSQDLPFRGEAQFLGQEGSEILNAQQREYHIRHKSFVLGEIQIPSSGQIPSSFPHGSSMHLHSLPLDGESFPNAKSVPGDLLQSRLLTKQEYSSVKDLPYSNHHKSFAWQHDTGSRFPSTVSGHNLVDPSVQKVRPEDNLPPQISGITMPKMPISMHHNPFASTFEQGPATIRFGYDASDIGPRLKPSLPNFRSTEEQSSPNITGYALETSGVPPHFPRRFVREPTGDTLYDPLFDSIEPSPGTLKKLVHAQKQGQSSTDVGSVLKFSSLSKAEDVPHEDRRVGASELKSVVDDSTEAATDAEVGVVENDSPQLIDGQDWSPDNAAELANTGAGEIEIDQVHSPGKKVKSKELRSMKLFKIALAEFVKEVLKPSWRQGNMSKEAFKTIVKKTVDKVSRSVPTRQIPKTQAKIDQYVESSQRKLTKLVMGYVDKYVKM